VVEISEFLDSTGRSTFSRWFLTLDGVARARITEALDRLSIGNFSAIKSVGRGVHELRINFGPGYRVYCGRDGDTLIILLGGGTKKRQQSDIATAQALWQQYKQNKREGIE
jgi:putative addiction module killer protein